MNIGISGYFNGGSFGDNLMVETWKQIFNEDNIMILNGKTDMSIIDKIIIGGGGILERFFFNYFFWQEHYLKYPVYVYGVGISDALDINLDIMKRYNNYLNKCLYVGFRDTYDLEHFNCNYDVIEDLIWSYDCLTTNNKNNTIGISLRRNNYNDTILELCKDIISSGYNLSIISLYDSDYAINKHLYNVLKDDFEDSIKLIKYKKGFENDTIQEIANLDFYITQKLHGFIVAMQHNVPSMILGSMNKFKYITQRLNMEYCLVENYDDLHDTFDKCFLKKYDFNIIKDVENKATKDITKFKKILRRNYE